MPEPPVTAVPGDRAAEDRDRAPGGRRRRPASVLAFHLCGSVLPTALMACLGLTAVAALLLEGAPSQAARLTVAGCAAGAAAVVLFAILAAHRAIKRERLILAHQASDPEELRRRLGVLEFRLSHGRRELQALAERIAAGEAPPGRHVGPRAATAGDPVANLAHELQRAQDETWNAVIGAARPKPGGGPVRQVGVSVNLARRIQTLSYRVIKGLDELENQVEDPDLLKGLFRIDHLSTRLRRQAESLAVVGGGASRRQWSRPVTMYEVLRSAIAEVEQFNRVKVAPPVEGSLDGSAVADVVHLLAELVENATRFSPPHTQVLLRMEAVTAGLAIEIEDRGLGTTREARHRMNELLADPDRTDVGELVQEGRIGLLVVSALSRRHRIVVRLQTNIFGGTQAIVVIPNELIGSVPQAPGAPSAVPPGSAEPAPSRPVGARVTPPSPAPSPGHDQDARRPALTGYQAAGARPDGPFDRADAVGGHVGEPSHGAAPESGRRPDLPRRAPQANLAPELRDAPAPPEAEAEVDHRHDLMAVFQRGIRSGEEEDWTGKADGPGQ
ncbi:ATP-binding protein [Actinomadura sp. KC345]|uniref:sensor histidine kinase n=1 Tax=Actinomadura sp. KC345 TaxID=2530371 RepID=UPI00104F4280|nr:ATP-binding protein [Actinomadura sp. KC345]TDC52521.1 ATP-binding protein [Actinomadura sp. KC345]